MTALAVKCWPSAFINWLILSAASDLIAFRGMATTQRRNDYTLQLA
jgi:hypothetical protein